MEQLFLGSSFHVSEVGFQDYGSTKNMSILTMKIIADHPFFIQLDHAK